MARWPSKARSDWKLRPRAGSFQRKSLERGMFARAVAWGLCWSWLWVACAGAAHMPAATTADTARSDNRHGLPLTLTPSHREWTTDVRARGGPRPAAHRVLSGRGDAVGASRGSHSGSGTDSPETGTRRIPRIRASPSLA